MDYRGSHATAVEAAIFGSMSGAIAAALTTPLDVIKTRIMLGSVSLLPSADNFFGILLVFIAL